MKIITKSTIINDLKNIGLKKSDIVLIHISFKSIGNLIGGPQALVYALQEIVTPSGTIIMPTQSGYLSDPSEWRNPPVHEKYWIQIKKDMIPYHKKCTPTDKMGIVPEIFRQQKNVFRSRHPSTSFAAWGEKARFIINEHCYNYPLGKNSPLQKLYNLNALILLIGVDHDKSTFLHLAEHYVNNSYHYIKSPIYENNKKKWLEWKELNYEDDDFLKIGKEFEKYNNVRIYKIGESDSKLINAKKYVDFAIEFMKMKR